MQQCIDNTIPKWKVQPELNAHTSQRGEEWKREGGRETEEEDEEGVVDLQITVWKKGGRGGDQQNKSQINKCAAADWKCGERERERERRGGTCHTEVCGVDDK